MSVRVLITGKKCADITQFQTLLADTPAKYVIADRGYVSHALRQRCCGGDSAEAKYPGDLSV